jgi:hypothetical protein
MGGGFDFPPTRLFSLLTLTASAAKACKTDAEKNCDVTWFFGYKAGNVISCLG